MHPLLHIVPAIVLAIMLAAAAIEAAGNIHVGDRPHDALGGWRGIAFTAACAAAFGISFAGALGLTRGLG